MKQRSQRTKKTDFQQSLPKRTVAGPSRGQTRVTFDIFIPPSGCQGYQRLHQRKVLGFPLPNSPTSMFSEMHCGGLLELGRVHHPSPAVEINVFLDKFSLCLSCAAQIAFTSSYRVLVSQPLKTTSNEPGFLLIFFFIP